MSEHLGHFPVLPFWFPIFFDKSFSAWRRRFRLALIASIAVRNLMSRKNLKFALFSIFPTYPQFNIYVFGSNYSPQPVFRLSLLLIYPLPGPWKGSDSNSVFDEYERPQALLHLDFLSNIWCCSQGSVGVFLFLIVC